MTENDDAKEELAHMNTALQNCLYPPWTIKRVSDQLDHRVMNLKSKKKKEKSDDKKQIDLSDHTVHGSQLGTRLAACQIKKYDTKLIKLLQLYGYFRTAKYTDILNRYSTIEIQMI